MSLTRTSRLIAGLLLTLTLAACAESGSASSIAAEPTTDTGPLRVVATFSVLGDLVQRVGGEEIDLRVLVGPGGDPHDFRPLPAEQAAVADADIVFAIGPDYEVWLDRLLDSSGTAARAVLLASGLNPLLTESGDPDPHVWHDVGNAAAMVGDIRAALSNAAPAEAAGFDRRAAALIDELSALDAWIVAQIATIPVDRRRLVVNHDSFGHLARRYGLEMVGAIVPALAGEAVAPSAGTLARLVDRVRASGAVAIFAEKGTNSRLAAQLAREARIPLIDGLYSGGLGPAGSAAGSYPGMIRANVGVLVAGLSP
jgi:ABC-type Zn uptake system ZnuABC Zn-binding protein ZnuA